MIVQSEKDAAYVESRVDAFWEEFMGTLEKMSEEEFDKYKEAVRAKKVEDHKNLWQESVPLSLSILSLCLPSLTRIRFVGHHTCGSTFTVDGMISNNDSEMPQSFPLSRNKTSFHSSVNTSFKPLRTQFDAYRSISNPNA